MPQAKAARTTVLPHPCSGRSMIPISSDTTAATHNSVPGRSRVRSCRALRGADRAAHTEQPAAMRATAMNSARQEPVLSTAPPPTLPTTPPIPEAAAQMAGACGRRPGAVACRRMPTQLGRTQAAPRPVTARPASMIATSGAVADTTAPQANMPSPAMRTPLRPSLSPAAPAGMTRQAKITT